MPSESQCAASEAAPNEAGHFDDCVDGHSSPGAGACKVHRALVQVATVSQAGTTLEPYSHSSASREQESPIAGTELGQAPDVAPLSSLPALASEGGTDPPPPASRRPASSL